MSLRVWQPVQRREQLGAFQTTVAVRVCVLHPLLDTVSGKLQIKQNMTHFVKRPNLSASAFRTALDFNLDRFAWSKIGPSQLSVALVNGFDMPVCSHKHLLTLVVEIGTLVDLPQLFEGVLLGTEHSPVRTIPNRFLCVNRHCASFLRVVSGSLYNHVIEQTFQKHAICAVVFDELRFQMGFVLRLPFSAPDNCVKSCCFIGRAIGASRPSNIF